MAFYEHSMKWATSPGGDSHVNWIRKLVIPFSG